MGLSPDVTVNHGSNSQKFALSGETVEDAIDALQDEMGWNVEGLDWSLTRGESGQTTRGRDLPDGSETVLGKGDTLTFLTRAGNKGAVVLN